MSAIIEEERKYTKKQDWFAFPLLPKIEKRMISPHHTNEPVCKITANCGMIFWKKNKIK